MGTLTPDQKEVVFWQTNNTKIERDQQNKRVDFTNLKVKKRTVIQRIGDLKVALGLFKEGLGSIVLVCLLYGLVYLNNLDFVRNVQGVEIESFTRSGGDVSHLSALLFQGESLKNFETQSKLQEQLMDINTLANKDNFILWTWNFWYYLSKGSFLFLGYARLPFF